MLSGEDVGDDLLEREAGPLEQAAEFGGSALPSATHHHHVQIHPFARVEPRRSRDHRLHDH